MNLDELQNLWNSSVNQPNADQSRQMVARFTITLRRRRRQELCWLAWTFFVLTLLTGFAAWLIFGTEKIKLSSEWAGLPLLLIPWVFAFVFLRRFLRRADTVPLPEASISESLTAAFAANESERTKMKALGLMYLIALPVLALCMWQLHSVGKISSRELSSMAAFLGVALALSAGSVLLKYRFSILPKRKKLKALLSQLNQMPG
jgi:hypothetical protein